jgi:hypothetical protein
MAPGNKSPPQLDFAGGRQKDAISKAPGLSANLTLPDCVRVARYYRELGFAPNEGMG